MGAEIIFASEDTNTYNTDLLGVYQNKNTRTAVAAIPHLKEFKVSQNNIQNGLLHVAKNTHLKGRWQLLQETPRVICDTAHNKEGLSLVMDQLQEEHYKELHIVLGVVSDKNLEDILPLFPKNARYYFCKPNVPRGMSEAILYNKSIKFNLVGKKFTSVTKAYKEALLNANQEDIIYVGGSTFVVAEII